MLYLVFSAREERFALGARDVVEVAPMVRFTEIPHAPAYVAGLFDYRGRALPALDLSVLMGGEPVRPLFSSRLVVADGSGPGEPPRLVGLVAEQVTETITRGEEDFEQVNVDFGETAYLGGVTRDAGRMVQRVRVASLLPEDVYQALVARKESR